MLFRWVTFIQNVIALQTLVKCKLQTVRGPGTRSCLTEVYFGQGRTQVMFVGEGRGSRLFSSLWSQDARLLSCEVTRDPRLIDTYRTFCKRRSGEKTSCHSRSDEEERRTQRFNLSALLSPNAPCVKTDAPGDVRGPKMRTKRSWIFPGTLWCGSGSRALGFDELGMFESADRCCREHDHCQHIIPALTVNYGVFNPNFFTVSHCDCDQRFRQCLVDVNDTISSMVLYSFFKILKLPCIELKLQKRCTEMHWWGMCKVTKEAPYALFKRPVYYNTSSKYEKTGGSMSNHEVHPSRKKEKQKCVSKDPPRGDTFFHKKTNGCRRKSEKTPTVAPYLNTTSLNKAISSKTKALKSLSVQRETTRVYVSAPTITPTTASSKRPVAPKRTKAAATMTKSVTGHTPSLEKDSPLTSTSLAAAPTEGTATAQWMFTTSLPPRHMSPTTSAPHYGGITIKHLAHFMDSEIQSHVDTPKSNQIINTRDVDLTQMKSLHKKTDFCESLKHLDDCSYKIPPLKKRFGLKNLDTKPAYLCACTRRLAREVQTLKQSGVLSLLEDSVSENCFKLPKRKRCLHRKSCSGGFTKASDLLQALKKIELNNIAGVQNTGKHRKRRNSVRLYKRCLRLKNEVMAPLI